MQHFTHHPVNLRRFVILAATISFLTIASWSLAQESEDAKSSPAASSMVDEKKIQDLKEKLATKVAEIRENQKRGFFGEIAALTKTSFTLAIDSGEVKIRFDEDTKIYKLGKARTEGAASDLKNSLTATVLGLYDEENKQQNAKVILLQSGQLHFSGGVTEINRTAGNFIIKRRDGKTQVIEYEKTTSADEYTETQKTAKSGLSRLNKDDWVEVWGTPYEDDTTKIEAIRIFRIPQELLGTSATQASPSASEDEETESSPKPSTTSKASPKASPES